MSLPDTQRSVPLASLLGSKRKKSAGGSSSASENLLAKLNEMSPKELSDGLQTLQEDKSQIVSEKLLAKVAHFLVSENDMNAQDTSRAFDKLLEFPFNPSFLTQEIRTLSLPIDAILPLISSLLEKVKPTFEPNVTVNLLDWICVILDANFKQIILSIDKFKEPLKNLSTKLDGLIGFYEGLESIRSIVDLLIHQDFTASAGRTIELPMKPIGKYSVDWVEI